MTLWALERFDVEALLDEVTRFQGKILKKVNSNVQWLRGLINFHSVKVRMEGYIAEVRNVFELISQYPTDI